MRAPCPLSASVPILLVESVLPGFPPPADGSGRTVHARCVQLALRASVPVRRRLRSCCCFESFQHLPIRLPLRAGPVESVASNVRHCGIVFGSRPAAALRASSAPSDPASCARDVRHRRFGIGSWCCCCCFESFERLPIRRAGFVGARTDVGPAVATRRRLATSVIAESASRARVRHDGTLLWLLLLLLLIPFGREISWTLLEEATPGLAERLREREVAEQ